MSRTLGEIVEACRAGERPEYDDLRLAVCCLDIMGTFDRQAMDKLAEAEREAKRPFMLTSAVWQQEERHSRLKRMLAKTPCEVLGASYNPDDPEVQKRRAASARILQAALDGKLPTQRGAAAKGSQDA